MKAAQCEVRGRRSLIGTIDETTGKLPLHVQPDPESLVAHGRLRGKELGTESREVLEQKKKETGIQPLQIKDTYRHHGGWSPIVRNNRPVPQSVQSAKRLNSLSRLSFGCEVVVHANR